MTFRFDFDRIKLADRQQFAADLQLAFAPPADLPTADADHLLVRWMAQTVVAWPVDGYHWDDPTCYAEINRASFMEGVKAFGAQFRTVFSQTAPAPRRRRKKHVHRANFRQRLGVRT